MRQRFLIFGALISLVIVLIGLNAASYTQKQKLPETEFVPNRSTYNTGGTGTQAFYSLLSETGRKVVRWQEPPDALKAAARSKPSVFVVIGNLKRGFTEAEAADLYQWVYDGGRLIIVDRSSAENLIRPVGNWKISFAYDPGDPNVVDGFGIDPADPDQITSGVDAARPIQPTIFTTQINGVQPSRLAAKVEIERVAETAAPKLQSRGYNDPPPPAKAPPPPKALPSKTPVVYEGDDGSDPDDEMPSNKFSRPPVNGTAAPKTNEGQKKVFTVKGVDAEDNITPDNKVVENEFDPAAPGPVVHLTKTDKAMLVDVRYGSGSIVYLSDPYILSNAGIRLVDNAQLGINMVGTTAGAIAFDEYHQGFGTNNNRLFQYFAGTPVIAIFVQCAILIGFIFFSQSRRFARPVPEPEPNRLSKLEYVAAMAELQARTRSFDLAIENIYTDFRRRAARLLGVDNYTTTRKEMAKMIAERAKLDPNDVEDVMFQCEDIMHGEPTNKKEVVALIGRLRGLDEKLGLKRTGRVRI